MVVRSYMIKEKWKKIKSTRPLCTGMDLMRALNQALLPCFAALRVHARYRAHWLAVSLHARISLLAFPCSLCTMLSGCGDKSICSHSQRFTTKSLSPGLLPIFFRTRAAGCSLTHVMSSSSSPTTVATLSSRSRLTWAACSFSCYCRCQLMPAFFFCGYLHGYEPPQLSALLQSCHQGSLAAAPVLAQVTECVQ